MVTERIDNLDEDIRNNRTEYINIVVSQIMKDPNRSAFLIKVTDVLIQEALDSIGRKLEAKT